MEIEIEKLENGTCFYAVKTDDQVMHVGKAATPEEARAKVKAWFTDPGDQASA